MAGSGVAGTHESLMPNPAPQFICACLNRT
jgi:hypothetical protein